MFTEEELEAAVLRYLISDVATERTEAGTRDIVAAKQQVYEIISTAFMLRPVAIFSLCWLASNRLRALVEEQLADLETILDAAPRVSKNSLRVTSTTDLLNAEASLVTLTGAFAVRTSGISGNIGPAVQRFNASLERFMRDELVKNTVLQGDVVETPEELRVQISTVWQAAYARHAEIALQAQGLIDALSAYDAVRLPDVVLRGLLGRIQERLAALTAQMEALTAPQDSRNALLEFNAMRTLLTQASAFRPPALQLAPLTGDVQTGVLAGTTGTAAGVDGAVNGPFNYAAGASLSFSVAGVPGTIALPGTSVASLQSRDLSSWSAPPGGSECSVVVDGGSTVWLVTSAWASGAVAAAALDAGLAGVAVTWDVPTSRLVFRSDSAGDASGLAFLDDTTARGDFVDWLFEPGDAQQAYGTPVGMGDVVAAFASDARLIATPVTALRAEFTGARSTLPGEEAVLWHRAAAGADLVTDGTTTARAAVDLAARGVVAGMTLSISAPTPAVRTILAVDGPELELSASVAAATNTYSIGPDYTALPAGTRVRLTGTADAGFYRATAGGIGQVTLDRALSEETPVQAGLSREYLRIDARSISPTSSLQVSASTGATALGLTPQTVAPSLDTFETSVDLAARRVSAGDSLALELDAGTSTFVIASVAGTTLRFTPPVPYEAGTLRFLVRSKPVQDYLTLRTALSAATAEGFDELASLDTVISKLSRGARFVGDLVTQLDAYGTALLGLLEASTAYSVDRDATIEQALRAMVEHGFDRAADLFIALQLGEFFSLNADGVSYKTWVMRTSIDVGRQVVPVSKDTRDPASQWRTVSVQPVPGVSSRR